MPNGRCRMHGGNARSGIAAPTYTHGRHSKYMPTRLQPRYAEAQLDPQLLELRSEIALLDARLADLLLRVDTGESGTIWRELAQARTDLIVARRGGDAEGQAHAINTMLELIGRGHADYAAWHEVLSAIEQRKRIVESERRRLIEMQQTMTVEKAMLLVGAIAGIIKAHVTDPDQLRAISADIRSLVSPEPRG